VDDYATDQVKDGRLLLGQVRIVGAYVPSLSSVDAESAEVWYVGEAGQASSLTMLNLNSRLAVAWQAAQHNFECCLSTEYPFMIKWFLFLCFAAVNTACSRYLPNQLSSSLQCTHAAHLP
jgi:hypothetical protein